MYLVVRINWDPVVSDKKYDPYKPGVPTCGTFKGGTWRIWPSQGSLLHETDLTSLRSRELTQYQDPPSLKLSRYPMSYHLRVQREEGGVSNLFSPLRVLRCTRCSSRPRSRGFWKQGTMSFSPLSPVRHHPLRESPLCPRVSGRRYSRPPTPEIWSPRV